MTASPQTVTVDTVFLFDSGGGETEPPCPDLAVTGEKNNQAVT